MFAVTDKDIRIMLTAELADCKPIEIEPCESVLTSAQCGYIKDRIRPKLGWCYKNATEMLMYFHECLYCEGFILINDVPVEHAFNMIKGKDGEWHYIDITLQYGQSKEDYKRFPYLCKGVYESSIVYEVALETQIYGGIWEYLYFKKKGDRMKKT